VKHPPYNLDGERTSALGIEEVPVAEPAQRLKFPEREGGGAWPAQGDWTYEDYLRLPDDGRRYEVLRGVLYVSAAPTIPHQFTVGELLFLLRGFVKEHDLGMVLPGPVDIQLPRGIATPVQPDLVFIRGDRRSRPRGSSFAGVPDLIIEVLSPSTRRVDQTVKLAAYRDAGVPEYWLADPLARTVVIFGLSKDGQSYLEHQRAGAGETVSSVLLPGFQVPLDEIFIPE
jgi:Uma2 family endonuclease